MVLHPVYVMALTNKSSTKSRQAKRRARLPKTFEPRFLESADNRLCVIRELKRRVQRLREDAGVDCMQKELLAQRAIFLAIQLETEETNALEGREFDSAGYAQKVNALCGVLKHLGFKKHKQDEDTLEAYVQRKRMSE